MLVKENQPGLYQALKEWFDHPLRWRNLDYQTAQKVNKGHGRVERRRVTASSACAYLNWPDVEQVILFEKRVVHTHSGAVVLSQHYGLTSLPRSQASAGRLLTLRRQHWAIENNLHYPRDVWFAEDASRIRTGQTPRLMASLRNLILNLLRTSNYPSLKFARERFAAFPQRALDLLELPVNSWLE